MIHHGHLKIGQFNKSPPMVEQKYCHRRFLCGECFFKKPFPEKTFAHERALCIVAMLLPFHNGAATFADMKKIGELRNFRWAFNPAGKIPLWGLCERSALSVFMTVMPRKYLSIEGNRCFVH